MVSLQVLGMLARQSCWVLISTATELSPEEGSPMTADSFSTMIVLVGPVEVGTPSKKDQSRTSLQTCRNSSLMA